MTSLGMSWVGLRVCRHPRPAAVLSQGETDVVIRCAPINTLLRTNQCFCRLLLALR